MLDNRNSPGTGGGKGRGRGGAGAGRAGRGGGGAEAGQWQCPRSDLSSCLLVSPDLASSSYVNISAHSHLNAEHPGQKK